MSKTSSPDGPAAGATAEGSRELEQQPDTFPIGFEEWAASQPAYRHISVAGFRMLVRQQNHLTILRDVGIWDREYAEFLKA